ncbi:MAG: hypothetical protein WAO83_22650 [Fuerstiella sp.]
MDLILGLVFFLSLMFLAMIFGDRLSLFGVVDGRWMTAPFDLVTYMWDMICEATDRVWCFVFDHVWWVTATLAGAVGLLLIALILVSGLSNEAQAVRQDERALMHTGSVLDDVPELNPRNILQTKFVLETDSDKVSHLVHQVPSALYRFPAPPIVQEQIASELPLNPRPPVINMRPLDLEPRTTPEFNYPAARLNMSVEPFLERVGHRIRSPKIDQLIQQTVLALRGDQWQTFSDTQSMTRNSSLAPPLNEDSEFAVEDLYSQVKVIPGSLVSSNNLKVEKSVPTSNSSGSFEIQIRVTNEGRDRVSGLIVRELLPRTGAVQTMVPRGAYRDGVAIWLLDTLEPLQAVVLTLQVATGNAQEFLSYTEVSAISAVSSRSRITPRDRPLPPVETPLPTPRPEVRLPNVKLTLENPPPEVKVDESVDVYFTVENIGNAPAEGVLLRIDVPFGLSHWLLKDDDQDRRVDSSVRLLEVGERRRMKLTVRPLTRGRHFATAELALGDQQLDVQHFEIVASDLPGTDTPGPAPRPTPQPDFR